MAATDYRAIHARSLADPEGFWGAAAEAIDWDRAPERVLDDRDAPFYRWFTGARLNTCFNALDRHADGGRGDQAALIHDSPVTGTVATWSYRELRDDVARVAGALADLGVGHGDRVVIYMPMIPETVMAMLACARLGAIHSVVFGGFAAYELASRIDDAQPRVVLSASCGIEPSGAVAYKPLLDRALELATHAPETCVILQRERLAAELQHGRDRDWHALVADAAPADCVPVAATDPLYILYTSGTTGHPKGVVRDNGGHAVALQWSMSNVYGVAPGEVFWAASDVGWVVGHSYIVYAPLLAGCTTVLFEGKPVGTPDPGAFWRVVAQHDVRVLFTAPTAFRAIKKEDHDGSYRRRYDLGNFRALFLAGERCDPDTLVWARDLLDVPVIDHWWQTETGWPAAANCIGIEQLPIKPGSATVPVPGYDMHVLDKDGAERPTGELGDLAIRLPLPPGCLQTLWNNDSGFRSSYLERYPGYYRTGDAGFIDGDGYVWIMSRTDDVINVAGHRLSTGVLEAALAGHPDVAECAVIGVSDEVKGQVPLGLVVLKAGVERPREALAEELRERMREHVGPVASFRRCHVVQRLPKTRSGKVLRATMRQLADGEDYRVPPTIDDPAILDEIAAAIERPE